jgi:hypothetical protein
MHPVLQPRPVPLSEIANHTLAERVQPGEIIGQFMSEGDLANLSMVLPLNTPRASPTDLETSSLDLQKGVIPPLPSYAEIASQRPTPSVPIIPVNAARHNPSPSAMQSSPGRARPNEARSQKSKWRHDDKDGESTQQKSKHSGYPRFRENSVEVDFSRRPASNQNSKVGNSFSQIGGSPPRPFSRSSHQSASSTTVSKKTKMDSSSGSPDSRAEEVVRYGEHQPSEENGIPATLSAASLLNSPEHFGLESSPSISPQFSLSPTSSPNLVSASSSWSSNGTSNLLNTLAKSRTSPPVLSESSRPPIRPTSQTHPKSPQSDNPSTQSRMENRKYNKIPSPISLTPTFDSEKASDDNQSIDSFSRSDVVNPQEESKTYHINWLSHTREHSNSEFVAPISLSPLSLTSTNFSSTHPLYSAPPRGERKRTGQKDRV